MNKKKTNHKWKSLRMRTSCSKLVATTPHKTLSHVKYRTSKEIEKFCLGKSPVAPASHCQLLFFCPLTPPRSMASVIYIATNTQTHWGVNVRSVKMCIIRLNLLAVCLFILFFVPLLPRSTAQRSGW